MDLRCRIELFGWLRVVQEGRVITRFQTRQTAAVLAYLAYHCDRSHPRDVLMGVAWPEDELYTDRHKLRVALNSLRRQLEPPGVPTGAVIVADRHTVQLNPSVVTTDVAEFEAALQAAARSRSGAEQEQRLCEAVAQYRGELLPGYYEAWVVPERQRLGAAYLQALGQLARHREAAGDLPPAIDYARRAVAADPLGEVTRHQLIRLLATAGQLEAARQQYRELEGILAREWGEAPAVATRELIDAIERELSHYQGSAARNEAGEADRRRAIPIRPATLRTLMPPSLHAGEPLPTGTLTFLLAELDVPGTPEAAPELLCSLLRGHGGHEVQFTPGWVAAAFGRASEALAAALEGMQAAAGSIASPSPLPRMSLDTGEVAPGNEPQHSPALEHATRLLLAAHPGQILVSENTAALLRNGLPPGVHLTDRGRYHLREGVPAEHLFHVEAPEVPRGEFLPPRATPVHGASLPLQLTRFFGREAELERLRELLMGEPRRLVTVTGPGGSGKTRLALELAAGLRDALHGRVPACGCWFVPLADLSEPGHIPDKVRESLGLARLPGVEPLEQVVDFLSRQRSLVLLDNFEQLAPGGAGLLGTLLQRVETLTLLVTSRQRLDLAGEREFTLAPLPVPGIQVFGCSVVQDRHGASASTIQTPEHLNTRTPEHLNTLAACPSVQLFIDRAQGVRPDFQVTHTNAPAIATLCTRLEGLPLAIELAAARAQVLTPAQMLTRLEQRFELLASRRRGGAPRHQSLWAALDWSYQLLSPPLQRFFARLSVFRGGWTAEAAEAVCEEPAALDYLTQLRGYSLVLLEESGEGVRYRLLESLREYAWEVLPPEERAALARRHATYFLSLAEQADLHLTGPEQTHWLNRLETEHDNLRAALDASLETSLSPAAVTPGAGATVLDISLRLAGALGRFWSLRGYWAEARDRLGRLLVQDPCPAPGCDPAAALARARALNRAGDLAADQFDFASARTFYEEALDICRACGDQRGAALSLNGLAVSALQRHELATARTLCDESQALFDQAGDCWGTASSLHTRAAVASRAGDLPAARELYDQALVIWRAVGDQRGSARCLSGMGNVALAQGDYRAARGYFDQCLTIYGQLGDRGGIAWSISSLGMVAHNRGDADTAQAFYEQGLAISRALGDRAGMASWLSNLGRLAADQENWTRAARLCEEAMAIRREIGDRPGYAMSLQVMADVAFSSGDREQSRALLQQSLEIRRALNDAAGIAAALCALGRVSGSEGDWGRAVTLYRESLSLFREQAHRSGIIATLEGLGEAAGARGRLERAARLLGAAHALREQAGIPLRPSRQPGHRALLARLREKLGERGFTAAWSAGKSTDGERAVHEALEEEGCRD